MSSLEVDGRKRKSIEKRCVVTKRIGNKIRNHNKFESDKTKRIGFRLQQIIQNLTLTIFLTNILFFIFCLDFDSINLKVDINDYLSI